LACPLTGRTNDPASDQKQIALPYAGIAADYRSPEPPDPPLVAPSPAIPTLGPPRGASEAGYRRRVWPHNQSIFVFDFAFGE
jgi:hypothetical protein